MRIQTSASVFGGSDAAFMGTILSLNGAPHQENGAVVGLDLLAQPFGEGAHGMLGRRIDREVGPDLMAGHGGGIGRIKGVRSRFASYAPDPSERPRVLCS